MSDAKTETSAAPAQEAVEAAKKVARSIVTDLCVKRGQYVGFRENDWLEDQIARALLAQSAALQKAQEALWEMQANKERFVSLYAAASDLCEEIRARGTHECWKQVGYALDAIEEADLGRASPFGLP